MSSARADRPRILILIKGLGMGGAERLIVEAAHSWDRTAFDYRVAYILPWKDHLVPRLTANEVPVTCIGGRRGLSPVTPFRLRRLIRRDRIALVHAHLPSAGILARVVAPVPVVYTEHNLAGSYRQPTRTLNRLTYRRQEAVTAVSQAVADSAAGLGGPTPVVVPNGVSVHVEADEVSAVRDMLGIGPDLPLIVHVGNIRPHKGHFNLVAAAEMLARDLPDFLIVSAGSEKNPGDLERVRRLARVAGIANKVRFLGRVDDARPLLAAADVVVNPADVEGLPVVLLEALALGRPVVATNVGGVPSVIRDGETGCLVPAGDPAALATAVVAAIADREESARWGKAGAEMVGKEFGVDQMVTAFEDIYRRLLRMP
jgi:L-malate glycosyltransferase